jgi:phenylpropionate dioxygenase-like ring-hydroxylating dioxygenase large terminal subunit
MVIQKLDVEREFQKENEELYQWTKQWYPVAVVDFLDSSRIHKTQLLGKDIILWRDGSGKWRCFDNACPHRLAPLSEGRVESDGTLLCSYHAWRFNGDGKCVRIPQSKDEQTEAKHCSQSKSCAVSYPTQERQGLLWVWAESGSNAQIESELKTPRLIPELENYSDKDAQLFRNIRDFPFGWDFYMENVVDPAHVPVAHHGILGNRYKDAKYFDMTRVRDMSTEEGFSFEVTPTPPNVEKWIYDFQPPCHLKITSIFNNGTKLIVGLYAIPTSPGWCRHIQSQILIKNDAGKTTTGLGFFGLKMPIWLSHVLTSQFLHQDLVFLHYQEKILAKRKTGKWQDVVYTPNPQDKMVIVFRKWWETKVPFGIPWAAECNPELLAAEQDKQKLFDVWTTHTQHCTVCQDALKNINRLTVLAYIAAIICFGLSVMVDVRAIAMKAAVIGAEQTTTLIPSTGFWYALGGAIAFATLGFLLKKFSRLFYVYEFEHAHND